MRANTCSLRLIIRNVIFISETKTSKYQNIVSKIEWPSKTSITRFPFKINAIKYKYRNKILYVHERGLLLSCFNRT
jgi:hypothetical protein